MTLPGTELTISRLGFGCAGLMARLSERDSLRLLEAALDAGITHFDTARLYGYGEAERVLGKLTAGHRHRVTIASKAGILPPKRTPLLTAARTIARRIAALHPSVRTALRRRAEGMTQAGTFDVPTLARSLETSLRELRTDYLDLFLLHECRARDLHSHELLTFLETAKRDGKVRHYGMATTIDDTVSAIELHPDLTRVVQFPSSVWNRNLDRLPESGGRAVLVHSVLGSRLAAVTAQLAADPAARREWSARLALDVGERSALARLLMAQALAANASGAVIFSSGNPDNIRDTALTAGAPAPAKEQVAALAAFARAFGTTSSTATAP